MTVMDHLGMATVGTMNVRGIVGSTLMSAITTGGVGVGHLDSVAVVVLAAALLLASTFLTAANLQGDRDISIRSVGGAVGTDSGDEMRWWGT